MCPGGQTASAAVFTRKGHWINEERTPPGEAGPIVYTCFADHCAAANGSYPGCAANSGTGCCAEGHGGLLCELCSDGYIKQNDACIACNGAAWQSRLALFSTKSAALLLVNAQLLNKASTKSCARASYHLVCMARLIVSHLDHIISYHIS